MINYIAYAILAALIAAGAVLGVALTVPPAFGHDWYPNDCCNQQDCQPIAADKVELTPQGWRVYTGELIKFGDRKERFSPDGGFHRCSMAYRPNYTGTANTTICLFVPGMGS